MEICQKTIAALLTVHNRKEKTMECLTNLFRQDLCEDVKLDIYLTDDGSTDGTAEAIKEHFPSVIVVHGDGTLFWNRGMYVAWKEAAKKQYDFYLWLNDDTFLYSGALSKLMEASICKKNKAIIVGVTQNLIHTQATYGGLLKDGRIAPVDGHLHRIHHFNGNIVLIPNDVFNVLGNLDWYFTHGKGDFDYGLRANEKGIEMFQVGHYIGECDRHLTIDKWCNPQVPFIERWKAMWRPNGMPPHETYYLERKHMGLCIACIHYITTIIRCCFPKLWL